MFTTTGRNLRASVIVMLLIVFSTSLFAAGRTAFPVAKTLMTPRSLALAGAAIADQTWAGGAGLNPASGVNGERQAGFSYARHSLDLWSGQLSASFPIPDNRYILTSGFYLSTFNFGELEKSERDLGLTGETFTAAEYVFAGYMSGAVNDIVTWGLSLKYLYGELDEESASGGAVDIGVTWDTGWHNIRLGAVGRNLGKQFSGYGSEEDPMPSELMIGGCRTLDHMPMTLHIAAIFAATGEEDWTVEELKGNPGFGFSAGSEFSINAEGLNKPVFVRLGYRSRGTGMQTGQSLDAIAGLTFGLGLNMGAFDFDYTYAPLGALGDVHRFGIIGTY
jgi:hypothetical protein